MRVKYTVVACILLTGVFAWILVFAWISAPGSPPGSRSVESQGSVGSGVQTSSSSRKGASGRGPIGAFSGETYFQLARNLYKGRVDIQTGEKRFDNGEWWVSDWTPFSVAFEVVTLETRFSDYLYVVGSYPHLEENNFLGRWEFIPPAGALWVDRPFQQEPLGTPVNAHVLPAVVVNGQVWVAPEQRVNAIRLLEAIGGSVARFLPDGYTGKVANWASSAPYRDGPARRRLAACSRLRVCI